MRKLKGIKKKLKELEPLLKERFKVKRIGIFGSYLRREEKRGSDVDILVDFEEGANLFDLVGLALYLEKKLGQKVDVVPRRALRKEIKTSILKEVISI